MNYKSTMRVMMAVAMLFAVQTSANAQFGGLKKIAKKAKDAVEKVDPTTTTSTTTTTQQGSAQESGTSTDDVLAQYRADHPAAMEKYLAEKAGGMDKYLGLDQTEDGKIIYKYFKMEYGEGGDNSSNRANARSAGRDLVNILRFLKGNTEDFTYQQAQVLDIFNNRLPEYMKAMAAKGNLKKPLPQNEINAFKNETARIKQLYLNQTGTKEKTAEENGD